MRRCALNTVDHFTLITRSWVATLSLGLSLSRGVGLVRTVLLALAHSLYPGLTAGHLVTAPDLAPDLRGRDLARHGDQAQVSGSGDMGLVTAVRCAAIWIGGGRGAATREKVIMINITLQQQYYLPVCV